MVNEHRRIERLIKGAIKKVKRGGIPLPPPPKSTTPEGEKQFIEQMKSYRRTIQANIRRLSADSSRAGHKRRLQLDLELAQVDKLLNA